MIRAIYFAVILGAKFLLRARAGDSLSDVQVQQQGLRGEITSGQGRGGEEFVM